MWSIYRKSFISGKKIVEILVYFSLKKNNLETKNMNKKNANFSYFQTKQTIYNKITEEKHIFFMKIRDETNSLFLF
jgi:hypothetical protein